MPLDELLKKYAGAYSKEFEDDFMQLQTDSPASSSCSSTKKNGSSGGENADVEGIRCWQCLGCFLKLPMLLKGLRIVALVLPDSMILYWHIM